MNAVRRKTRYAAASGFTLIELAVVIMIMAIVAAFAVVSLSGTEEARDASLVESAQASLQQIVTQGATRMDVTPAVLVANNGADIEAAAKRLMLDNSPTSQLGGTIQRSGGNFELRVTGSNRSATYQVNTRGEVMVQALGGFTKYGIVNGDIQKL